MHVMDLQRGRTWEGLWLSPRKPFNKDPVWDLSLAYLGCSLPYPKLVHDKARPIAVHENRKRLTLDRTWPGGGGVSSQNAGGVKKGSSCVVKPPVRFMVASKTGLFPAWTYGLLGMCQHKTSQPFKNPRMDGRAMVKSPSVGHAP